MSVVFAYVCRPCMFCREAAILSLDPDLYARWQNGEHIQDVWPHWTPAQRELLITGTHPECWDANFGEEN